VPRIARAESYPSRPIHFVVGFPTGGAGDLIARLIGNAPSERLNQTILLESKAGASGNIATEYVVRARPDGYTLLDITSVNAWNLSLYDNLKFDILRLSDTAIMSARHCHPSGESETHARCRKRM
jgi:tripartite-type tricarboxylate transporter receptor subunit TctC